MRKCSQVMRLGAIAAAAGFALFTGACCPTSTSPPKTAAKAEQFGSLAVSDVVAGITDAVLGSRVTDALEKEKLAVKAVSITLQIEDETAGDAQVAVLVSAKGSISRATSKQLTLQFSVPESRAQPNSEPFKSLMAETRARQPLNTTDLVAAIEGAATGVKAGKKLIDALHLGDKEFNYQVDFVLTRSVGGGIDVKLWGTVGLTAEASWTRTNSDQVIVTFVPK